jgi:hypothetical protein
MAVKKDKKKMAMMIHEDCLKSKPILAREILKMIGHKPDKSKYTDGNFNKREIFAVHYFIKKMVKK